MTTIDKGKIVATALFKEQFAEIKDDLLCGRITFYNTPVWTEKTANIAALNITMLVIYRQAKLN